MTIRTTVRSWRAMGVAGIILAGTCYVLFQDVINGAPITTGHVLTGLALMIATAASHCIVPTFKIRRYPLTACMVILAVGSILYIGLMSGARNAEQTTLKAERIDQANKERARIAELRKQAQAMLDKATAAVAAECSTGLGKLCVGKKATKEVYEAAVKGHDADLARLGAHQTPNAGYKAVAEGLIRLPWFRGSDPKELEETVIILLTWLAVLLAELSVPVFLAFGLGHEIRTDSDQTSFATRDIPEARRLMASDGPASDPPKGGKRRKLPERLPAKVVTRLPAKVIALPGKGQPSLAGKHPVIAALELARKPLSNSELADAMNVCGGESTKRRREVADMIDEQTSGKFVLIGLKAWRQEMA
jgi:hypothetical protein